MRIILADYIKKMKSTKAIVDKMLASSTEETLGNENVKNAKDFLEMYKKFTAKLVGNRPETQIYNGDINKDIFSGPNGNKVVGIVSLKKYGLNVVSALSKAVKEKK